MARRLFYRYDHPTAPEVVIDAAAALSVAGVDLTALPWVQVDLAAGTATAHADADLDMPTGESSQTMTVPELVEDWT